ncbi:hypothetical protein K501DRAFT_334770 [Backusella circina FSU 941]|nr:hypothetical protein K501DRAFT_334770 [Backusella circina FSU 941]
MSVACPKCPKVLKNRAGLFSHNSVYHNAVSTIRVPNTNGSLREVAVTRTPSGHIHCPICNKEYVCTVSLQTHVGHSCFGGEKTKDCPYCNKTFRHLQFYKSHVDAKICVVAKERARIQSSKYHTQSLLKRSKVRSRASSKPTLKQSTTTSSRIIKSKDAKRPVKKGLPFINFKCPFCKYNTKNRSELQHHLEEECFEPPFGGQVGRLLCFECLRCFETRKELNIHHYNYHAEEIKVRANNQYCHVSRNEYHKFDCPQCQLTFNFPSNLKAHLAYFCGETEIKCPECANPFETMLQLNTHINSHHTMPVLSHESTPELSSPISSILTSPSTSSLDDPILIKKSKQVTFSCHSCLNTFKTDRSMRDHLFMDTCTPRTGVSMKRKNKEVGYRKLKHVKVKI